MRSEDGGAQSQPLDGTRPLADLDEAELASWRHRGAISAEAWHCLVDKGLPPTAAVVGAAFNDVVRLNTAAAETAWAQQKAGHRREMEAMASELGFSIGEDE
jgi:hypothetical protein